MEWTAYVVASTVATIGVVIFMRRKCYNRERKCGKDYPQDTVILHQFPRGPFAPSMSAFCVKLETFLRMANIPYKNVHAYKTGSKGKSPWIEYNGVTMGDSQMIITFLKEKLGIDLNKSFSPEEMATAHAFQRMVDEHTYWLVLLERWVNHRKETSKTLTKLPSLVVWEIGRRTSNMAYAQGVGRHSLEDTETVLETDLVALSDFLGEKKFMFGEKPSEVDCAVFGQLSQVKWHVPEVVKGRQLLEETLTNLNLYCERMKNTFWPDWEDCNTYGFTKEASK